MLIFVYGDDTFRVAEKVRQIKDAFIAKFDPSGFNTDAFPQEGTKLECGPVLQSACSFPFLGEKRMVIVRDLVSTVKADAVKTWLEGFGRIPESTIVIFWETEEPKKLEKKTLFKKLIAASTGSASKQGNVHFYPFPELQGRELNEWIRMRVKHVGGTISRSAVDILAARVGSDLWQMHGEIGKLVGFADGTEITVEMVENLVRASFEGQIFALIDAVSRKQTATALRMLREERSSGANDFYLMTMLARQVRVLIGARSLLDENPYASKQGLADAMGVHPFVAQKALAQAKGFRLEDLMHAHDLLFEFDRGMKSGRIDADMAVDLVTVDLMN